MVAGKLSEMLADGMRAMTSDSSGRVDDEVLGLVFPVYSWGLPRVVDMFLMERLPSLVRNPRYIYAVMTCGDDVGFADKLLEKRLKGMYGHGLDAVHSVFMPNTYVCLPGFDVDGAEVAAMKVEDTMHRLPEIAEGIRNRRMTRDLVRGSMPWAKTYVVRPLFNLLLVTDRYFRVSKGVCTACNICVASCPLGNIRRGEDGNLHWGGSCTGCLACYHSCPRHALHFGSMTKGKGQHYSK